MKIDEYITHLRKDKNIIVSVRDGELKIRAAREALTENILEEIRRKKPEILDFFKSVQVSTKSVEIDRAGAKAYYSLSSVQQRLYFLHQFEPTSLAYNVPQVLRLTGNVDQSGITRVFKNLIARHESLRTFFELVNGEPVQKISEDTDFGIEYFQVAEEDTDSVITRFIRPFNVGKPPLIRVGLIGTDSGTQLLMVDMHHIITDGVSVNILINDFMAFYNNEELPPLQLQYKDYAEWQQGEGQKQERAKSREFWLSQFREELPAADLPTDFQRPLIKSFEGSTTDFALNVEETIQLKRIADKEESTLFMVLLAIFNVLLSKLSGQEDIVIGIPIAGRQHADLENIIGMFVNTLPLRNYPDGNLSFNEFLALVKSGTLACLDNQSYPYEELLDELQIGRDMSRNPLFDIMFAYQNFERTTLEIPGLTLTAGYSNHIISKFDITFTAVESGDQVFLNAEYCSDLFKRETIERFIRYFKTIAGAVIADPNQKISTIEMISEQERRQLIYGYNDTDNEYTGEETIIGLFERQVEMTPENIALRVKDETVSYRELKELSDRIAWWLQRDKGVMAGDLVCIMLDRDEYLVACILGILKTGAAYIPIDPAYPSERALSIIKDSQTRLVITGDKYKLALSKIAGTVEIIELDQELPRMQTNWEDQKRGNIDSSSLAYIIYTSGSTGEPKGVMIEHQSLVNYISWAAAQYTKGENEGFALYSSISFDLTVTSIFVPLITGNSIIIYPEDENGLLIEQVITANAAEIIKLTPAHLRIIRDSETLKNVKSDRVKRFIVGGEQLDAGLARDIYKKFNGLVEIYNEYGPTEATVGCMIYKFDQEDPYQVVPIGAPAANTQIYILDKFLQPVGTGVQGEMYVSGAGLARGYHLQEKLTRGKFIGNPFVQGKRMYKTGDIATRLDNGNIVYKGRIDDQVKIRGYRIELGEIESQIKKHQGIEEAIIVVREKEGDKFLTCYYISHNEIDAIEFRNFLMDRLPDYMIPVYFVRLMDLPLTANGKLNRKGLPDPQLSAVDEYEAASNATEEKLVEIWANVLGVGKEKISVKRSFFEMGGNSLKIVRLHSILVQQLKWHITIPDMFRYPTIASLTIFMNSEDMNEDRYDREIDEELAGMENIISSLT